MSGDIRERLSALSRGELAGIVVLVVVLLSGVGLWYVRSLPRPVQVRAEPAAETSSPSPSSSPVVILVDVAGWVRSPGVYEFHEGDRVIDAIEAAGGARRDAALESLNLAAPLADGTQILVARRGVQAVPGAVGSGTVGGTTAPGGETLVNVNTASASELEALPGVGEVIAQRIVDHRTANGPFASIDELLEVSGIGEATLEAMREQVTI